MPLSLPRFSRKPARMARICSTISAKFNNLDDAAITIINDTWQHWDLEELEKLLEINIECCTPSKLFCILCAWLTAWPVHFDLIVVLCCDDPWHPCQLQANPYKARMARMARMACNNLSILLLLTLWWLALEQVRCSHQEWGPVSKWRQSQGNVLSCRTVHGRVEFCLDMNCE